MLSLVAGDHTKSAHAACAAFHSHRTVATLFFRITGVISAFTVIENGLNPIDAKGVMPTMSYDVSRLPLQCPLRHRAAPMGRKRTVPDVRGFATGKNPFLNPFH